MEKIQFSILHSQFYILSNYITFSCRLIQRESASFRFAAYVFSLAVDITYRLQYKETTDFAD